MIGIFNHRYKNKNFNEDELMKKYIEYSKDKNIIKTLNSSLDGLDEKVARSKLKIDGKNEVIEEVNHNYLYFFFNGFKDQFVIILLVMAIINFVSGDKLGALLIVILVLISIIIRSKQEYETFKFNKSLKSKLVTNCNVIRNGKVEEINVSNIVVGDIVELNAGTIIPADVLLIENKNLYLNMAVFTGESRPIRKSKSLKDTSNLINMNNICLMGSSVITGSGKGIVISTGFNTYLGHISKNLGKPQKTNFEKGMDKISNVIIRFMIVISLVVFCINYLLRGDLMEALLFAISIAVGITPSMLPTIINSNLSIGAKKLSRKKTLVKNLNSIQNLGAIDILCTDKTGTLTQDEITLQKYIDVNGEESMEVLKYAYANSFYGTGIKNLVDRAIMEYGAKHSIDNKIKCYKKIDEIPFDYNRRMMSIVVDNGKCVKMISKGAMEVILKNSKYIRIKDEVVPINDKYIEKIKKLTEELELEGMQVIALAEKIDSDGVNSKYSKNFEIDMTFVGLMGFLDPPKKGVKNILTKLKGIGIQTKVLTGDNPFACKNICNEVGLKLNTELTGDVIDKMSDYELKKAIEEYDVFARLNPLQKNRIIDLYKENGHVVGYMGDGVNDAPSLHSADVGISVNNATSIAKESSDIILLEKSLSVIYDGVIEGRRTYGNIMKYVKMAVSANFGDAFSILIASIFLPFLPIIPIQMLIQDMLYEMSQTMIPYDDVDKDFLKAPKKWDTSDLNVFMNIMGAVSSIVDCLAFLIFWYILGFDGNHATYFQTAWFLEGLISQTMIVHYVRTSKIPFIESCANKRLIISTFGSIILGIITPYLLHNIKSFHFEIMPASFYLVVIYLLVLYSLIVEIVKRWYINKYHKWL